jgi:hypothetical protein
MKTAEPIVAVGEVPSPLLTTSSGRVSSPKIQATHREKLAIVYVRQSVPDQILIAVFPELRLYGFRGAESWFPEFLKVLEEGGATGVFESP